MGLKHTVVDSTGIDASVRRRQRSPVLTSLFNSFRSTLLWFRFRKPESRRIDSTTSVDRLRGNHTDVFVNGDSPR